MKRAFPSNAIDEQFGGMSERTWLAGMALSGILSRAGSVPPEQIAERAVAVADATLAQLDQTSFDVERQPDYTALGLGSREEAEGRN